MIQIPIAKTSFFVLDHISQPHSGKIHSIYRNTVNLMLGEQLISLQTVFSPLSPLSVILPMDAQKMETAIYDRSGVCRCGNHAITIEQAEAPSVSLFLSADTDIRVTRLICPGEVSSDFLAFYLNMAKQILTASAGIGFAPAFCAEDTDPEHISHSDRIAIPDPVLAAARQHMEAGRLLFAQQRWTESAGTLCHLIGLGSGLTPSGDDFLCGLLSCLGKLFPTNHPFVRETKRQIRKNLYRTHDISRAFLDCALRGEYSTAILNFFQKGYLNQPAVFSELNRSFLSIGHSSGLDSLCGIYYGLKLAASEFFQNPR